MDRAGRTHEIPSSTAARRRPAHAAGPDHALAALQRGAGNAAVTRAVQRDFLDGAGAFIRGMGSVPGAAVGVVTGVYEAVHHDSVQAGLIEFMGKAMTDEEVVAFTLHQFSENGWVRGRAHLEHYLYGQGADYVEDVGDLIGKNPRAAARLGQLITSAGGDTGVLTGTSDATAPIRKPDYDDMDWWSSLGNVDQFTWTVVHRAPTDATMRVSLTLRDPYEWHPLEDRDTQPLHEAFEDMKTRGTAKDFLSVGTAEVSLPIPAAAQGGAGDTAQQTPPGSAAT